MDSDTHSDSISDRYSDSIRTLIRSGATLILNWFRARKAYSSGFVEGLNPKINLTTRKAYGYRSFEVQ